MLVIEGGDKRINFDNKAFKPVPEKGIALAVKAMQEGVMFRYQPPSAEASLTAQFEQRFAKFLGVKHAVGVNSCGSAMFIALNIAGVQPGDKVLSNAFTFHAVPSVIHHARAEPVLIESTRDWSINPEDLARKAQSSGAKVLLLSYMRGHVPDMDAIMDIVERYQLILIEDCAHAYCTYWDGKPLGTFGKMACFSAQSSKGLSAGEGGIFTSNDDECAAKAVLYAGSYETFWQRHFNLEPELLTQLQNTIPGYSMRMHEVTAAMLLPQIDRLPAIHDIQTRNYNLLVSLLANHPLIDIPQAHPKTRTFNDTLQFHLMGLTPEQSGKFIDIAKLEGLPMQVFGIRRNARDYRQWQYVNAHQEVLPETIKHIETAVDLSLQPHLTEENIRLIAQIIIDCLQYVSNSTPAASSKAPIALSETPSD